jgi:hypothetical protein
MLKLTKQTTTKELIMNTLSKVDTNIAKICLASCQKILAQIQSVRRAVLNQFHDLLIGHEQVLRAALNEAEALAWQTPYPHLFFADLAEEKAHDLAAWSEHQHAIRR